MFMYYQGLIQRIRQEGDLPWRGFSHDRSGPRKPKMGIFTDRCKERNQQAAWLAAGSAGCPAPECMRDPLQTARQVCFCVL